MHLTVGLRAPYTCTPLLSLAAQGQLTMAAVRPGRLSHSLLSKRLEQEQLPGDEDTVIKDQAPTGLAVLHGAVSTLANVLIPVAVHILNVLEWGRIASAAWYCLPKVVMVVFKLVAVAWQSRIHGLHPEKKAIDLDKGAYKFVLYVSRAVVDLLVAPLWYHFLGESLFSLTPASALTGVCAGATMWMLWLLLPK